MPIYVFTLHNKITEESISLDSTQRFSACVNVTTMTDKEEK